MPESSLLRSRRPLIEFPTWLFLSLGGLVGCASPDDPVDATLEATTSSPELGDASTESASRADAAVEMPVIPPPTGRSIGVSDLPPIRQGGGTELARVGKEPVTTDELVSTLYASQTEITMAALERTIQRRVVTAEAKRHEVTVRDSIVNRELEKVLKAQDDEFKLAAGPNARFEDFVRQRFGTSAEAYQKSVRGQVLEDLLLARVVRYVARQEDRIEVGLIVVDNRALAEEIELKLSQGANFGALAKEHSLDASAAGGGRYPPIPKNVSNPLLAGAADLSPGEVGEIFAFQREGKPYFRILKLERLRPRDVRPYSVQEGEIERELTERPLDLLELLEWESRMWDEYAIELYLGRS